MVPGVAHDFMLVRAVPACRLCKVEGQDILTHLQNHLNVALCPKTWKPQDYGIYVGALAMTCKAACMPKFAAQQSSPESASM